MLDVFLIRGCCHRDWWRGLTADRDRATEVAVGLFVTWAGQTVTAHDRAGPELKPKTLATSRPTPPTTEPGSAGADPTAGGRSTARSAVLGKGVSARSSGSSHAARLPKVVLVGPTRSAAPLLAPSAVDGH